MNVRIDFLFVKAFPNIFRKEKLNYLSFKKARPFITDDTF